MNESQVAKVVVYLGRHAETSGNVDSKITEPDEDCLTDLGKVQTNLLGTHLSSLKIDYAYSSDYGRAVHTAEGIIKNSKESSNIPVKTDPRLREVNFGEFEAASYNEILQYTYCSGSSPLKFSFPGGESFREAGLRILGFVEEICENILSAAQPGSISTVLIVSHTVSIVNFCNALHESESHEVLGWDHAKDLKLMSNASYMRFEVEKTKKDTPAVDDNSDDSVMMPASPSLLRFTFSEKHASRHLDCIKTLGKKRNGLLKFCNEDSTANKFAGCVQQ